MPRLLEINTPLGKGNILLRHLSGHEELGRLSEYHLSLVAKRGDIKASELLGKNITIGIELPDGNELRYLNGYITQISDAGHSTESFFEESGKGRAYLYEATLHTSLWFLTRNANCRMFQKKTVPQIVGEVLDGYPFAFFDQRQLIAAYPEWEYCCQYRETDFNFISRLMEQEGIYYYFDQVDGKHTLMLCDAPSAHAPMANYEKIPYSEAGAGSTSELEPISDWHITHQIQPGRYALNDFNFVKPRVELAAQAASVEQHDLGCFEYFDYPGEYEEPGEGKHYVNIRLEELHSQYEVISGSGSVRGIQPGHTFELVDHPREAMNREYLVIAASYSIANNGMGSGGGEGDFHCSFQAIPSRIQFRPRRHAPKPLVQGPQTALVVGPSGEEIHTDQHGRVKVQFHWDRYNQGDDKSSCWIRVSHPWAGKEWGMVTIPRIGHEVVVSFLDGNPDCPLVTGSVYNGEARPPYVLPANKTQSGIKSRTCKGCNTNFNEIRFEDKQGSEHIYIHAEKDKEVRIKHDRVEWVGNESHLTVKKDVFEKIDSDRHLDLKGDDNVNVGGTVSLMVGQDWLTRVGNKLAAEVGMEVHLKAGANVVIESGSSITLKVGGNFININPGGVFINGVIATSGGSAGSGSGASPQPPRHPKESVDSTGGAATTVSKPIKPEQYSPQAQALRLAAKNATPFCALCKG